MTPRDIYANQEAAYLLQAIGTYPGLVILATNRCDPSDDALLGRVQASIRFPHPRGRNGYVKLRPMKHGIRGGYDPKWVAG